MESAFSTTILNAVFFSFEVWYMSPRTRYSTQLVTFKVEQRLSSQMFFKRSSWYLSAASRSSDAISLRELWLEETFPV